MEYSVVSDRYPSSCTVFGLANALEEARFQARVSGYAVLRRYYNESWLATGYTILAQPTRHKRWKGVARVSIPCDPGKSLPQRPWGG